MQNPTTSRDSVKFLAIYNSLQTKMHFFFFFFLVVTMTLARLISKTVPENLKTAYKKCWTGLNGVPAEAFGCFLTHKIEKIDGQQENLN